VTLALVRKARILVWTAVGLAFLMHRGLSIGRALAEAGAAAAESRARPDEYRS
jgi:hypothetical protein